MYTYTLNQSKDLRNVKVQVLSFTKFIVNLFLNFNLKYLHYVQKNFQGSLRSNLNNLFTTKGNNYNSYSKLVTTRLTQIIFFDKYNFIHFNRKLVFPNPILHLTNVPFILFCRFLYKGFSLQGNSTTTNHFDFLNTYKVWMEQKKDLFYNNNNNIFSQLTAFIIYNTQQQALSTFLRQHLQNKIGYNFLNRGIHSPIIDIGNQFIQYHFLKTE